MKRTSQQNKAVHKYLDLLSTALNDAGYETKAVLEVKQVEVPWNGSLAKELLWRPIMKALTGKESTTEMDSINPSDVYLVLDRHISENFGVHVEFPSEENQ